MNDVVLRVRELTTTVRVGGRDVPAVAGVSFDLKAGRTLGLVGESGSGKSLTALSLIRLLAEPAVRVAGGQVLFHDGDLVQLRESELRRIRGRRIAMIFQEPSTALNPVLTIGAQVGEPLRIHEGLSRAAAMKRAIALLERVGIPSASDRAQAYPHELSGGMKQRAMIAMALACNPEVLIADEPTTALDVTVQAQILELLADLRRELGMALLLITHDLGVVAETCDDVAVMYGGRIVEQASAAELFGNPRHPYTAGLMRAMPGMADTVGRTRLREIPGTVPSLGDAGPGCAFANRCARVQPRCNDCMPELIAEANHGVRCFFPQEGNEGTK